MPTVSVFFRKRNYVALRKAEEKTGVTIGLLLNKLVRDHLKEVVAEERRTHAILKRRAVGKEKPWVIKIPE